MDSPPAVSPSARETWPHRGYAWYVVIVLMVAYGFSIIDRIGLGLLVQPIEADLHISDGQMGLLQGAAFAIFYSVLGLPIGLLADRTNRRSLITVGIMIWSAATIGCGLARGFPALFTARIGVGAGEAALNPAGTSMIADYFPPDARSKAYSVYLVGTSMGTAMALLLGGGAIALADHLRLTGPAWLSQLAGWKIVFFMIGAPGLLVGLLFALTVREPERKGATGAARAISLWPLLELLWAERRVYAGLLGGSVLNAVLVFALVGWFPTLLIRLHGWAPATAGRTLGAFSLPCGVISCISAGWVVAWLEKWGRADAPIFVAITATAWVVAAGVAASLAPTPVLAVAGYCMISLAINYISVAILTAVNRITPNSMRGQMSALFLMAAGLVALSVGPFAVGWLSDNVFGRARGIGDSLASVIAMAGLLSIALLASAGPSYRRLVERTLDP